MAFTVFVSGPDNPAQAHTYGDNDIYSFPPSGRLIVKPASGTHIFTYNNWIYLAADADHGAGGTKKGKSDILDTVAE